MHNQSSRHLQQILLFIALYSLLFGLVFIFQIGTATPANKQLFDLHQAKLSIASSIKGRRILIVSGSNGFLGVRASLIEKATGIKTVNMAMNVRFGTFYMLDKAEEIARAGDIIILPLEYGLYQYGKPESESISYIVSQDPAYFYNVHLLEQFNYMLTLSPSAILSRAGDKTQSPEFKLQAAESAINASGDYLLNRPDASSESLLEAKFRHLKPVMFQETSIHPNALKKMEEFSIWCKADGVRLFATFPSFVCFPEYRLPQQKKFFNGIQKFYDRLGVSLLGNPYDFMYGKENFFDGVYHLTADAAEKRTLQLIAMLQAKAPNLFPTPPVH